VKPMSSNAEAVVNCAAYADGRRIANIPIHAISEHLADPKGFVWIGLHEPSEELLKQIQEEFQLHELAIEDAHRAHQRPKLETYGDSLFVVIRPAQMNTAFPSRSSYAG
jgi:magnesium transporter